MVLGAENWSSECSLLLYWCLSARIICQLVFLSFFLLLHHKQSIAAIDRTKERSFYLITGMRQCMIFTFEKNGLYPIVLFISNNHVPPLLFFFFYWFILMSSFLVNQMTPSLVKVGWLLSSSWVHREWVHIIYYKNLFQAFVEFVYS